MPDSLLRTDKEIEEIYMRHYKTIYNKINPDHCRIALTRACFLHCRSTNYASVNSAVE